MRKYRVTIERCASETDHGTPIWEEIYSQRFEGDAPLNISEVVDGINNTAAKMNGPDDEIPF